MKLYLYTALMATTLLSGARASAQKADTLRRQLQVLTSEDVQLDEREPLSLTHQQPRIPSPKVQAFSPKQLSREQSLNVSPLSLLSPMPTLLSGLNHLGYVSLAGGIKYNAYLSAGLRPIQSNERVLDILLNGRYTDFSPENNQRIKEYSYGIGADYLMALGEDTRLGLALSFADGQHNYNALYGRELRQLNYRLSASLDNEKGEGEGLKYSIRPYLHHSHMEHRSGGNVGLTPNEYHFGVDALLAYRLSRVEFGVSAGAYALMYTNTTITNRFAQEERLYDNSGAVSISPYVFLGRDTNLSAKLGAGVDMYRFSGKMEAELKPEVEVLWKFAPTWQVALKTESELVANSLEQTLALMPYLNLGTAIAPTTKPLSADLRLSGLISPNLSLTLFAQYSSLRNALNFTADRMGGFTPSSANGNQLSFGGQIEYRPAQVLTLQAGAASHTWSKELWGRPSMSIDAALTYKPNESLELNASYEMQYGIKQELDGYILPTGVLSPKTMESLSTYSMFRFGGTYRISPRLSVRAFGHILPSSTATLYYGHTPQRVAFNIGASYQF